ncbi:MAG: hypothetical protein CMQ41_12600 [Gammaproteobacteria bacterium]|nr:hypothetical protein [Gammaproteobacteria bacterium]
MHSSVSFFTVYWGTYNISDSTFAEVNMKDKASLLVRPFLSAELRVSADLFSKNHPHSYRNQ